MLELLAVFLGFLLLVISAIHFYWALGGVWPASDEITLVKTVIGSPPSKNGIPASMPPRMLTFLVAIAILAAAFFPIIWAGLILPYPIHASLVMIGMWVLTAIFLLRGITGMLPFFDRFSPEEPFRSLNRKYYSPLCLLIALGLGLLIYLATY